MGLPVVVRPDYRYSGGKVDTSAVMEIGYAPIVMTKADIDHVPSLDTLFGSGPTGAGTAATR